MRVLRNSLQKLWCTTNSGWRFYVKSVGCVHQKEIPQLTPDLTRIDDDWEDWDIKSLLQAMQEWLKRNKLEEMPSKKHKSPRRRKRTWLTTKEKRFPMVKAKVVSVFIVMESTGEINVRHMSHWLSANSSLLRADYALIVVEPDIVRANAVVGRVSNARANITLAFVMNPNDKGMEVIATQG